MQVEHLWSEKGLWPYKKLYDAVIRYSAHSDKNVVADADV